MHQMKLTALRACGGETPLTSSSPTSKAECITIRYCTCKVVLSCQLPDPRTLIPGPGYGKLETPPGRSGGCAGELGVSKPGHAPSQSKPTISPRAPYTDEMAIPCLPHAHPGNLAACGRKASSNLIGQLAESRRLRGANPELASSRVGLAGVSGYSNRIYHMC